MVVRVWFGEWLLGCGLDSGGLGVVSRLVLRWLLYMTNFADNNYILSNI